MTIAYSMIRSVRIDRQQDEMGRVARRDGPKMALILDGFAGSDVRGVGAGFRFSPVVGFAKLSKTLRSLESNYGVERRPRPTSCKSLASASGRREDHRRSAAQGGQTAPEPGRPGRQSEPILACRANARRGWRRWA